MVFLCSLCCAELGFHADRRRLASSSSTSSEIIYDSSTITTADIKYDDDVTGKCENYPEKHTTAEACKAADCKSWMIFAGQVQAVKACFVCGGKGYLKMPQSHKDCLKCGGNGRTSDDPENVQIWYKPHDKSFVYIRDNDKTKEHFTIYQANMAIRCPVKEWVLLELKGHGLLSTMRNRWFHADKSEAFLEFILNMTAPDSTTKQGNFRPSTCTQCNGRYSGCSGCNWGEIDRFSETKKIIKRALCLNNLCDKQVCIRCKQREPVPDTPLPFYYRWGQAITESPMLNGFWNWVDSKLL